MAKRTSKSKDEKRETERDKDKFVKPKPKGPVQKKKTVKSEPKQESGSENLQRSQRRAESVSIDYTEDEEDEIDVKEEDEYLTSAQKRNRKRKQMEKADRQAAKNLKKATKIKKPRKQGVKILVNGADSDDTRSVTSAVSVTTRSGRTVRQIDYDEWNDVDIQPSTSKDDSPDYEIFEKKKARKQQAARAATGDTSAPRMAAHRDRMAQESDTDEDKDDIQEPEYRDAITLTEYECEKCLARMYEDDRSCCGNGKRWFPPLRRYQPCMHELFFGNSKEAKEFRRQILVYNTLYSFASMQSHKLAAAPHGLPVVKVQGAVNSFPSNAFPLGDNKKAFGQFYVHTGQEALDLRMKVFDRVDKNVMEKLQKVMDDHNSMAELYQTMGKLIKQREEAGNGPELVRMKIIDACKVDPAKLQAHAGVYRPTDQGGDYVAVFYTASIDQHVDLPGLIIYPRKVQDKPMMPLFYWDPKVAPLCYPLFFPYGEYGYERDKFPLETDVNKTYWQRYYEYYQENEEEAKNWEVQINLEQAKALAENSKNKKKSKDSEEDSSEDDIGSEIVENNEDQEENDQQSDEPSEGESIAQQDNSDILRARREQRQADLEEQMDYDLNQEEMDEDMDDAYGVDGDPQDEAAADDSGQLEPELQQLGGFLDDDVDGEEIGDDEMDEDDQEPGTKKRTGNKGKRRFATRREYEVYHWQRRMKWKNRFAYGGKLSQMYIIHTVTQIYQQRTALWRSKNAEYLNSNKSKMLKALNKKIVKTGKLVGYLSSVPSNFPGSPRWLYRHFLNAVTMCNHLGKCDLFITATTNVKWPEIQEKLEPGQKWADAPFLVNQVFREKFKKLMDIILGEKNSQGKRTKKGIFGRVKWYTNSIEFQQRGPPHAHCVVSLKRKIKSTEQIEKICQAAFPEHPELRQLVEEFMVHKPCEGDLTAYCRKELKDKTKKQCKKGFPKEFSDTTKAGDRHYPELKRPDDGEVSKKNRSADNRYVVPYNATLLSAWRGHINIEVISSLRVVKYIFKYLFKGFDRALVETVTSTDSLDVSQMTIDGHLIYPKGMTIPSGLLLQRQKEAAKLLRSRGISLKDPKTGEKRLVYDEFVLIQDMRALTSCEAAWEIAGYERHGASHVVYEVSVHEEDKEPVRYKAGKQEEVAKRLQENDIITPLKAWFQLNQVDPDARQYNYGQIPIYYSYKNGQWVKKKRVLKNSLGTVATVSPRKPELFAIRLLSLHSKGVQSFEKLRTIAGRVHETFVDAAKALGLMNDEKEWEQCLREAAGHLEPISLRRLFGQILTSNPVADPRHLWDLFATEFYERRDNWSIKMKEAHALDHLSSFLAAHGQTLEDYNLPKVDEAHLPKKEDRVDDTCCFSSGWYQRQAEPSKQRLNSEQRPVFDQIFKSIEEGEGISFFLQGSGGTGKTEIMKALYYNLAAENKNVACVAHTGIAANLLPQGTTAHRKFRIPLTLEDDVNLQIELESPEATSLEQLHCVIWDEATMTDVRVYRAIHNFFIHKRNWDENKLFGGVCFIFAGDWKQTLPIIDGIKGIGVLDYTMLKWDSFKELEIFILEKNMRASKDPAFAEFLEDLGHGRRNEPGTSGRPEDEQVKLTDLEKNKCFANSPEEVIRKIFGVKGTPENKLKDFKGAAVLTVDNNSKHEFNDMCLDGLLSGKSVSLFSVDEHDDKAGFYALDPESYHKQRPPGMPLHELKLKIGAVVMLMRNMNNYLGFSNGTRLVVTKIGEKVIYCKPLARRSNMPDEIALSRVVFAQHKALSREVAFKRTQFPIQLAFCMTCNKSQGQTLDRVGIILRTPCFAHGQFYVACSRVRTFADLVIYNGNANRLYTNNVVYQEIFKELKKKTKRKSAARDNVFFGTKKSAPPATIRCPAVPDDDVESDFDYEAALQKEDAMRNVTEEMQRLFFEEMANARKAQNDTDSEKNYGEDEPMEVTFEAMQAAPVNPKRVPPKKKTSVGSVITAASGKGSAKRPRSDSKTTGNATKRGRPGRQTARKQTSKRSTRLESSSSGSEIERTSSVANTLPEFEVDNYLRLENPRNFCFANVIVQSVYRAWKAQLFINSENNIFQEELREIIRNRGAKKVEDLLKITPKKRESWTDKNGRPQTRVEDFGDGRQHDAEELWTLLMEKMPEIYLKDLELESIEKRLCLNTYGRRKCGNETYGNAGTTTLLTIKKTLADGASFADYLEDFKKPEKREEVAVECRKCSERIGKETRTDHLWSEMISVPTTTRLCAIKILLRSETGALIKRNMAQLPAEITAFDCRWKPIVLVKHTGSSKQGHYIVYVRSKNGGWLEIDDQRDIRLYPRHFDFAPEMTNICFVLLEKIDNPDVTVATRMSKPKQPRKTTEKSVSHQESNDSDDLMEPSTSNKSSIPDVIELRPSTASQQSKTRVPSFPGFDHKSCLLLENPGKCSFANVAVQAIYRMFRDEILKHTGATDLLAEIRKIVTGQGTVDVRNLLHQISEKIRKNPTENEVFDDGQHHRVEDFWTTFAEFLPTPFRVMMAFGTRKKYKCDKCKAITHSSQSWTKMLTVKKYGLAEGTPLDQYIMTVQSMAVKRQVCRKDCLRGKTPYDPDQQHWERLEVEIQPETRFLAVRIELREEGEDGSKNFIDREMTAYDNKFMLFGHKWKPIVMIQHIGCEQSLLGGHYTIYLRNSEGWISIDDHDEKAEKMPVNPNMKRICLVILEKIEKKIVR